MLQDRLAEEGGAARVGGWADGHDVGDGRVGGVQSRDGRDVIDGAAEPQGLEIGQYGDRSGSVGT